jgi:hypothetical protein
MTAPPRDCYEWVDTASLDPDFYLSRRVFEPRVIPQRYSAKVMRQVRIPADYSPVPGPDPAFVADLARLTRETLFPNLRRRRVVLDQAVRQVRPWECSPTELVGCEICVRNVRAEFQRLWAEKEQA